MAHRGADGRCRTSNPALAKSTSLSKGTKYPICALGEILSALTKEGQSKKRLLYVFLSERFLPILDDISSFTHTLEGSGTTYPTQPLDPPYWLVRDPSYIHREH